MTALGASNQVFVGKTQASRPYVAKETLLLSLSHALLEGRFGDLHRRDTQLMISEIVKYLRQTAQTCVLSLAPVRVAQARFGSKRSRLTWWQKRRSWKSLNWNDLWSFEISTGLTAQDFGI